MTNKEYYDFVVKQASDASNSSFDTKLMTTAFGLAGESGEVADQLKKVFFQGRKFDKDLFLNELGDILWYVVYGCHTMDVSLEDLMEINYKKLSNRYKSGKFTVEESENREI